MATMAFLGYSTPNPPNVPTAFSPNPSATALSPPPLDRAPHSTSSAANDIVNKKADTSLYMNCINLRKRLASVPGFETYLRHMDQEDLESGEETDPVTSMWNMLRQGFPLMELYNASVPAVRLTIDTNKLPEAKWPKAASFQFLNACIYKLHIPAELCFLITDLYGTDTTGFVKVLRLIDRVLNILQERGLLMLDQDNFQAIQAVEPARKSHSQMIVQELVNTERDYVQHLETLQAFKDQLDQSGMLPGDVIHDIFLNLSALLDFQQRFLIRIEQQNAIDSAAQNWGSLFVQYQDGFRVYEPFIGNQHQCNETVTKNWVVIERVNYTPEVQGMVGSVTVLTGFLLKPFQRLSKYPLLLDELRKRSEFDQTRTDDLAAGAAAMKAVLDRANALLQKADLAKEVTELVTLVDDWKGHRIEHFGDLIMNGTWPVLKGEGNKDAQREYKIYLFQRILLCCKELNPNKAKNRLAGRSAVDKRGKPKLQLKGRIFIQNVTDVVRLPPAQNGAPNSYTMQIWWKGDPGIESFTIRFPTAEVQQRWFEALQRLKETMPAPNKVPTSNGVSENQFTSLSGLTLENPYEVHDDDVDDDIPTSTSSTLVDQYSQFSNSRTASANSLRARSTNGSANHPQSMHGRVAPPRFPIPEPQPATFTNQLRVNTSMQETAEDRMANSAFSPSGDSPNSARQSFHMQQMQQQQHMFPPRQHTPVSNMSSAWPPEQNRHSTHPPVTRPHTAVDEPPMPYPVSANGRPVQRPSLPHIHASQAHHANPYGQPRSRSISSPDVNQYHMGRRTPNGHMMMPQDEIPVPPLPPNVAAMRAPINRSQSSSPTEPGRNIRPPPGQPIAGVRTSSAAPHNPPLHYGLQNTHYNQNGAHGYGGHNSFAMDQRQNTTPVGQAMGGPPRGHQTHQPQASGEPVPYASQLKVKVHYEPDPQNNFVTIVVPVMIKYRSLIDRIDSKMERTTESSIAKGTARLRYRDANGDLVRIDNDDDIQMAIEDWSEEHSDKLRKNHMPDFDLYWRDC